MTADERKMIREEISRRARARVPKRTVRPICPEVYLRVLAACCDESPIDIEKHALRITRRVCEVRA